MTPKEKAKELVDKFYQTTPYEAFIDEPCGIGAEYKAWEQAKQCALIAVDEVILANPHSNPLNTDVYSTMDYWQEVKQEIENL
jgi:hypothetical protein